MTDDIQQEFKQQRISEIAAQGEDASLKSLTRSWFDASCRHNYCYHFDWLSRPIIQFPQDVLAMQEILWRVKPDLVVECGIAHGGSLIFSASMLAMIDYCAAAEAGVPLDPKAGASRVLGIDIDIRSPNRRAIESHPLSHKIEMIEGSSIAAETIERVRAFASSFKNILVVLDSNHTHDHVLAELKAYASLTSVGSYCAVFDTAIEDMPADMHGNRPWGPGNSPKTAVMEFLRDTKDFVIDHEIDNKILISASTSGYLKRVA